MAKRLTPLDTASEPTWRTSSHTQANGQCVELAKTSDACLVRDSKDPDGPRLAFAPRAWASFLATVKTGGHDLA